jgi:hypothetical protein
MPVQTGKDELLQRFGSVIGAAADAMVGPPKEGGLPEVRSGPLRRLHEEAERYLRLAKTPRARFELFFLSVFLQDVFYNLLGDVPYEAQSHRYQEQFFLDLANDLRKLSSTISDESGSSFEAWERMVSSYCETVSRINDILG